MMRCALGWHARPGLAGGIDKDGSRADELLAIGFGSVEFGSVMPEAVLPTATRLSRLSPMRMTAIGAGIGLPPEWPAEALGDAWLAGLNGLWSVVDYLSFNLSAAANRRFLLPEYRSNLTLACQALKARRDQLALERGRYLPLALKMPLGGCAEPLPVVASMACSIGFDQLTLVLPDEAGRFARLEALAKDLNEGPALVAVGGIRGAADVLAARQAGAAGVQVHRLFVEQGAACLAALAVG
jgi:dihydroorotate dehydrogenase